MINQIEIASEQKDSNLASTLAHETRKNNAGSMFKKASIVLFSALLLAGVIFISSCKDDDEKSNGTKAGEEICACFTTTGMPNIDINEDIVLSKHLKVMRFS